MVPRDRLLGALKPLSALTRGHFQKSYHVTHRMFQLNESSNWLNWAFLSFTEKFRPVGLSRSVVIQDSETGD